MRVTGASDKQTSCGESLAAAEAADLVERAAAAARAELRGERHGILGALGPTAPAPLARGRAVPDRWTLIHVMDRMEEAFKTLSRLPLPTRPKGYINSMPIYLYDRGDLNSQAETYELERMAKLRNRVRLPPSPAEIERMEQALHWPAAYLSVAEFHHVARAVNLGSLWAAFDVDIDGALKRIKITRRTFNARKLQGLRIIAIELIRRRVPVT
jgi:hypothetical protein